MRGANLCRACSAKKEYCFFFWLNYIRSVYFDCLRISAFLSPSFSLLFSFHRERSREHHHKSRSKDSRSEKSVTINTPPAEPLLGDSSHRGEQFQVELDAVALTELSHNAFTVCHMGASEYKMGFSEIFQPL